MLGRYLLTLVRTLTIEGGVAYLLGLCKSQYKLTVVMVNLITHPVLSYLLLVLGYLAMDVTLGLVIILEILVSLLNGNCWSTFMAVRVGTSSSSLCWQMPRHFLSAYCYFGHDGSFSNRRSPQVVIYSFTAPASPRTK